MRLPILSLLLCLLPFPGCSSEQQFHPDRSLLVPWTGEAQQRQPPPPYVARYAQGGKRLSYIAALHEHQTGCDTFELVASEFQDLAPEVVVVEGFESVHGLSPEKYRDWAMGMPKGDVWEGGEPSFAVQLATKQAIEFIGGEPDAQQIVAGLKAYPIELRDLIFFYVVRQIPQWKRTGQDQQESFEELYAKAMGHFAREYQFDPAAYADPQRFIAWYEEKNEKSFAYDKITTEESAPVDHPGALFTNQISFKLGTIRNGHTVEVVAEMLQRFDRVLVIYGAGHHVQQEKVLEEMMGPPFDVEPFNLPAAGR